MRTFFRIFAMTATFVGAVSCTSASFDVAAGDAAVDPCAPVDGVARFCVTVKRVASHPGYDATTGAGGLGIDGKGTLDLLLFTVDPVKNRDAAPAFTVQYNGGAPVDIDHDIPVTISSSAPEGTYWFAAVFNDDTTSTRDPGTSHGALAGDFVTLPTIAPDLSEQFPTATLTIGKTAQQEVSLSPVRRVIADLRPSAVLQGIATANKNVHGDGPVLFVIYDGTLDGTSPPPTIYDLQYTSCVNLFAPLNDSTKAYPVQVPFYTTASGKHSLVVALYDWSAEKFDARGAIFSPLHDTPGDHVAQVDIGESWSSEPEATMVQVVDPYTDADPPPKADPFVCK